MIAIACVDENWGIGKCGELLFHIKKDMESLKALDQEFFNNGLDKYVIYKTKVI